MIFKSVCVFLGSSVGKNVKYCQLAKQLGEELVKRKVDLIYGGGRLGLMGILADTVISNGGNAIGVITKDLFDKEGYSRLTQSHLVQTMQERKVLMTQLADACIALPGGLGTLEEIFEVWNAVKLGIFTKPFGILDINNYYADIFKFASMAIDEEFMAKNMLDLLLIRREPSDLFDALINKSNLDN